MASRYWRGGNWNDINNWAASNGGAPGETVPTSSDNVYIDTINQTSTTYTINATASCLDMDWTDAPNNPTLFNNSYAINIYGSLTFISAMSISGSIGAYCIFAATSSKTITTAGHTLYYAAFNGASGEWTLQDDLTIGSGGILISRGTLNTNDKTIITSNINSSSANAKTFNMGSSTITISDYFNAVSTLTISAGTSKIIMTGNSKTFTGGGKTFYDLECQGTPITIVDANTFNDIKGTAGKTIKVTAGTTQTITDMSGDGTSGNVITLESTSAGSAFTLSKASSALTVEYYSIKDCTASGGATFVALDSTDVSGNTGWIFWETPVTHIASDYYNYDDVNRVEGNTEYIATYVEKFAARPGVSTITTNWDNTGIPNYDDLNRIEGNILAIKTAIGEPAGWTTPKTDWVSVLDYFGYVQANRLETNLEALGNLAEQIYGGLLRCGDSLTTICGKGNTFF